MNVKPGDLAYITHPTMLGHLVEVLYQAPTGFYTLPDGYSACRLTDGLAYVCKSLGSPFPARLLSGKTRKARYVAIDDRWLRPIRGDGLTDGVPADEQQPQTSEA
jgi:hypothetical protein